MREPKRKGRHIKRPASWYITWTIIYIIIAAILMGFIGSLPVWRIKELEVKGNNYFSGEKIAKTAKIPMEENIFQLDGDEVAARFSNIIQIKKISVRRKLPNRIVITVTERKPFAIAVVGDKVNLIDDEGFIIEKQNTGASIYRSDIAQLPVIRGISARSIENGNRIGRLDRIFMKNILNLLSKSLDIRKAQLELNNAEGIVIFVEDFLKVKIGGQGDIEKKTTTLAALIRSNEDKLQKISYIDVSVPENPVIKFK